jgi:hypothetical protein
VPLQCRELVPTDRLACVRAFTRLFDALATPENGVTQEEGPEAFALIVEVRFRTETLWPVCRPVAQGMCQLHAMCVILSIRQ